MLGLRIAHLRKKAGMRQSTLARKLNVSDSAVGMYEQGRREPPADIIIALSKIFGVSIDYLLTGHFSSAQDLFAQADLLLDRRREIVSNQNVQHNYSRDDLAVLLAAYLMD